MAFRNQRSRVALAAVAGFIAVSASAHADAPKPSFADKGELVVCTDATFPPMEFFEAAGEQKPVGYDIDLAEALAEHWGLKPRVVVSDFTGLLPGLEAQRCDAVISGILVTPERTKTYDAAPYLGTALVVFTSAKSDLAIADPADLSGKVVAVQAGTHYVEELEKVSAKLKAEGKDEISIQTYPKQTDVIQQVLVGRAAAAVSQDTELAYRELQHPGQLKIVYAFPGHDTFGVYLRRNGGDKQAVATALSALAGNGALKSITEKWHLSPGAIAAGE
ncbi:ABC transporter substrate-binding protein [Mesorhizobium sp. SP-1A]|uniref:ABC transporter substrate-binding protein n=1 Tax=Mesorhizobium sp. SP-1A TaxID=3077840 RepID=UPI0028F708C0|nr:ABC transporter substrate-binding protein [Mesorhizobium sp. SP-1A]